MKQTQNIRIDHIGWVTNDIAKFESFWVDMLGFKNIWESHLTPELSETLFGLKYGAVCRRYKRKDIVIEIHKFDKPTAGGESRFNRFGINHIALHVESRNELLQTISDYANKQGKSIPVHIYHNPGGWDNMFIQDFEGNWIELRETFK